MKGKNIKTLAFLLACSTVFATAGLVSCKDNNKTNPPVVYTLEIGNEPTNSLKLSTGSYTLTLSGEYPENGVVWASSDPTVATVENGTLTLVGEGVAKITVSLPEYGVFDEITIEIENDIPTQATGITILNKPTEAVAYNAENLYLDYALSPDGAQEESVVWTSSKESVATVDNNGTVRVLSDGQTLIRVALQRDSSIYDEFTLTVAPWQDIQVLDDDGTFEEKSGGVSVYSAHAKDGFNGFGWSREVNLIKTGNDLPDGEDGKALKVLSKETSPEGVAHIWSAVFIHFDTEIEKGKTYNIDYDAKWLGEENATGFYYSIDKATETGTAQMIPQNAYADITLQDFFRKDGRISFVATEDCDGVYLQLVNNNDVSFNFTIDNLSLTEDISKPVEYTRYAPSESVTLLSNRDSEITEEDSVWEGARASKILKYYDDSLQIVSENAVGTRNIFFVRFDTEIVKGKTYDITFDGEWLGETDPYNLHYSLDTGVSQTQSLLAFTPIEKADLFKTGAKLTFTANEDCDYFYLRIISDENTETEGLDLFRFKMDNISVAEDISKPIEYTRYTLSEKVTLLSNKDNEITETDCVWDGARTTKILKYYDDSLQIVSENAEGTRNIFFIRIDQALTKNGVYDIILDGEWFGETDPYNLHYSLDTGVSQTQSLLAYTPIEKADLFKVGAKLTFTANENCDYFYLRIISDENTQTEGLDLFDFAITSLRVEKQPRSVAWKGDDGTFENKDGVVSLYTVADQGEVGLAFAWANVANLSTVTENGNTCVKVQGTENSHQWDMLYIKFDKAIENGKSYTITFDATWLGDNLADGVFGYWILAGENCSATIVDYTDAFAENIFKQSATITFTANGDYDYFYLLLREDNEEDPSLIFNFTIDNISAEENL